MNTLFTHFKKLIKQPRSRNRGQGLVEYALILALVSLAVIAIVNVMEPAIGDVFSRLVHKNVVAPPSLAGYTPPPPPATPTPPATFVANPELTVNVTGSGTVTPPIGTHLYSGGQLVDLEAIPAAGWEFDHWISDDIFIDGSTNATPTIQMTRDKTVTAVFEPIQYTLTLSGVGSGDVSATPTGPDYADGTIVILTASPHAGYAFQGWTGNIDGEDPTDLIISVNMTEDRTITAHFDVGCYLLTIIENPDVGGDVTANPAPDCNGGTRYTHGTVVALTASPTANYSFSSWSGDATGNTSPTNVTMDQPRTVTANFTELPCYTVNVAIDPAGSGNVALSPAANCGAQYREGTNVTFTAHPTTSNAFYNWGGDLSGVNASQSLIINAATNVTAHFGPSLLNACEYVEDNGRVIIEAEHYFSTAPGSGSASNSDWYVSTTPSGYAGNRNMRALPASPGVNTGDSTNGPRLDYHINFQTTGNYTIWVRAYGENGNDDSLHVGFGTPHTYSGTGLTGFSNSVYEWRRWNTSITVSSTGLQTLSVWMRENGLTFDRIALIRTGNTATGISTGSTAAGPTESTAPAGCPDPDVNDPSLAIIYASSSSSGTAGGVSFRDEDILAYHGNTSSWAMYLDGSDVGLSGSNDRDVDAFYILPDNSILLSFVASTTIPDIGNVDDSDIVRFVPTSIGSTTSGTFSRYFDGSDVGLTTNGEDIDALAILADGRILISTVGSFTTSGITGRDEDLIAFTPTQLGSTTSGSWSLYFDGSDVGLTTSDEDVKGVWVDNATGDIYLTTNGSFNVTGAAGARSDIFICTPSSLGNNTSCTFSFYWDGSANGYGNEGMDGLFITLP